MARVLADTNVLFPFSLMDLMLALSQDRIHTLLWSDRLLDEDALDRAGVPVFARRARSLLAAV